MVILVTYIKAYIIVRYFSDYIYSAFFLQIN
jgi:hypothetical protein